MRLNSIDFILLKSTVFIQRDLLKIESRHLSGMLPVKLHYKQVILFSLIILKFSIFLSEDRRGSKWRFDSRSWVEDDRNDFRYVATVLISFSNIRRPHGNGLGN